MVRFTTSPLYLSFNTTRSLFQSFKNASIKFFFFKELYFVLIIILASFSTNAQVVLPPSNISCTSKDLEITRAVLPAPVNDQCSCSGTRTLQLGIINKTGSFRTSFTMWGKLIRRDANNIPIGEPEAIFACVNGVEKNSTKLYTTSTQIDVFCNQTLEIVDVILAWTSASPNETCEVLKNNPSTINPKCGRVPAIIVETGVNAVTSTIKATCEAGGEITVSPFGGVAPYTVTWNGISRTVAANASTTFQNVPAGANQVTITDSRGCSTTKSPTVDAPPTVVANAGADFTKSCSENENGKQIGEASDADYTYSWAPATGLNNAAISNPTANPSSTQTYTVTKRHTASGCTSTDEVTVTVNKPTVVANAGADFTKSCSENENGKQIGEASDADYTYSWAPATGLNNAAISNPTANPSSTQTYTVTKRHTASGCTSTDEVTVTVNNTPSEFTVCIVQPTLCESSGSVTFNATSGSGLEYSIDNGTTWSGSNVFNNLASGSVTGFKVKNSFGCIQAATCDVVSNCETENSLSTAANARKATYDVAIRLDQKSKVAASPNPFSERIRFTINSSVSGRGTLELYNLSGQKVKTVFEGQVQQGQVQTVEYMVPASQRSSLIYVFTVGSERTTGKLINLKQ